MLLLSKPTPRCAECDAPAKIQALFTREVYYGRYCLTEGQLKYVRSDLPELRGTTHSSIASGRRGAAQIQLL